VTMALGTTESKILTIVADEENSMTWIDGSWTEVAPLNSHSTITIIIFGSFTNTEINLHDHQFKYKLISLLLCLNYNKSIAYLIIVQL